MKTLIVYSSLTGNTKKVAEAIAAVLPGCDLLPVEEAPASVEGYDLVALGYWVDNTPRHVGDIMVFAAGQAGADGYYGHVAIVEQINPDGSIVTSECGASMNGKTYSKTYTNPSDFQFIHY